MDENGNKEGLQNQSGSPSGAPATPSGKPPEEKITLTQAELNQRIEDAANARHSKLDTRISQLTSENEGLKSAVATKDIALTATEQRARDAEIKGAGENVEVVNVIKARHALEDKQRELDAKSAALEADKRSHTSQLSTANAVLLEREIDSVMTEQKLTGEPAKKWRENIRKFGGDTPEKIREYVKSMVDSGALKVEAGGGNQTPPGRPGGMGANNQAGGQPKSEYEIAKDMLSKKN